MIVLRIILWIIVIAVCVGLIAVLADIPKRSGLSGLYAKYIKRFMDAFLSTGAIIIFSPILLTLIIVGAIKMKGNPFFTQERPGWHEKVFKLIKFRTMSNEKDKDGNLLPDEVRLNSYGMFLRSTSLDERVIIGQTTESLENKGLREVSPIHFHRGLDLFSTIADHANIEGILCQSA